MQELMVFAGTTDCYGKCNEIIGKFLSIEVSAAQVYRVTEAYGAELSQTMDATQRTLPPARDDETVYIEADGAMVLTRDEGWKEVKTGRIFKSGDCIDPNGKEGCIRHSQYLSYLGDCKTFTGQMDDLLFNYGLSDKRLVFLSDGATWIRNWVADAYPGAVSILDYYHACEHLYTFTDAFFNKDRHKAEQWAKCQKKLLLSGQVKQVIANIGKLAGKGNKEATHLIEYYKSNQNRMDYKRYRKIGIGIIGSGAIESAQRTVVQKRMKLSGQRWSITGAQHMLQLRTTYMNEQWHKIIQMSKTDFKNKAA